MCSRFARSSIPDNEISKRQEVGRGLRLCVNKDGVRQDLNVLGEGTVQEGQPADRNRFGKLRAVRGSIAKGYSQRASRPADQNR